MKNFKTLTVSAVFCCIFSLTANASEADFIRSTPEETCALQAIEIVKNIHYVTLGHWNSITYSSSIIHTTPHLDASKSYEILVTKKYNDDKDHTFLEEKYNVKIGTLIGVNFCDIFNSVTLVSSDVH